MKSVQEFTRDEVKMIIPEHVVCESSSSQSERKVSYHVKDGTLLERVELVDSRRATAFPKDTSVARRSYTTDFDIIKALYVTFTPKTPEDYLCLIGVSHIDFYALADDQYCSLAIPFKIWDAYVCNIGILLERNCFSECTRDGNPPDASQLFSLTHPYNEIFPVLCKFREKSESCQYAFRNRRMCVVPSSEGVSRTSTYAGLVLAYDFAEKSSHLFYIRRCTKEERQSAKDELLLSGYGGIFTSIHTPASIRSFYSPNFFDRRFAAATEQQTQQQMRVPFDGQSGSPCVQSPFARPSPAVAPATGNRITPLRHTIRTRSMLAAAHNENLAFASSVGGFSGSVHSSSANSSLQRAPRSERKSLLREVVTSRLHKSYLSSKDYTPTRAGLDESELLSLGRDDSVTYLDCSVEFCLEWLWSERERWDDTTHASPIPLKAISKLQVSAKSASCSTRHDVQTNHPGETGDEEERRPPQCFSTVDVFGQHYFVYNVPSERQTRVLRVKCREEEFSVLKCCSFPNIVGVAPLLHSRFYVALERSADDADPTSTTALAISPRIVLFSGALRLGIVSMNSVDQGGSAIQVTSDVARLRPGGVDSFRCICEVDAGTAHEADETQAPASAQDEAVQRMVGEAMKFFKLLYPTPNPPSCITDEEKTGSVTPASTSSRVLREYQFELKLGMSSRQARNALMAMIDSFRQRRDKERFITETLEANIWRTADTVMRLACCEQLTLAKVELSLLIEQYLAFKNPSVTPGLPTPIHRQVLQLRETLDAGESSSKRRRGSGGNDDDSKFWEFLCRDAAAQKSGFDEYLASASPFLPSKLLAIIGENQAEEVARMCDLSSWVLSPKPVSTVSAPALKEFPQPSDTSRWTTARWTADIRVDNVAQMLDSSLPVLIPPALSKQTANEAHLREQQEQFLLATSIKTLTRSFGQAILGYGSKSKSKSTERIVRPICLHGKANPGQMQIEFPASEAASLGHKQLIEWANFYNSVAHGLASSGLECDFRDLYQQADHSPQAKAGYLLASGLIGKTRSISLYDIHECLTRNDKYLVMALLVGCAISNKGTSSVHVYKVLSAHLPFLLMPTLCEFKIPSVIQCSALISTGILFAETMNTLLTNQLLNEMSKETFDSEQSSERYAYVLSAGFAVGLVNLGKGREITDSEIPIANTRFSAKERLLKLLRGGPREQCMVLFDRKVCSPQVSGTTSPVSQESESATCVRELPDVNIHLTSPAACAALALMYLRTGDKWISNALAIPNTFCDIERIRPDVLMMRVAAKCLVDYDEIGTSVEWVEQQMPDIVRKYVRHFFNYRNPWWETFVDMDVVAQAYFYCAAGACFAMALRHPSSWDTAARSAILNVYNRLQTDDIAGNVYSRLCMRAGRNCVSACVNVCAISLGILMAGSGDLHTTRVLRKIRNHIPRLQPANQESGVHSLHSFCNMALGLVYLGHGRYRLGRSNLAVSSLLMAFFPVFPSSLADNRAYLQVMRFLWTMAVDDRIVPVDEHKAAAAKRGVS